MLIFVAARTSQTNMAEAVLIGFYLLILLYSVILHEISHGVAALRMGDPTAKFAGRLTLNPKSHIDPMGSIFLPLIMLFLSGFRFAFGWAKPVPFNPHNLKFPKWGPALVALAGPVTNYGLALIFALIGKAIPLGETAKVQIMQDMQRADWSALAADVSGSLPAIVFMICMMAILWNVLLGTFNLIPIPPLDGSRLLFSVLDVRMETQAMLERYGFFILIAFIFLFPAPLHVALTFAWGIFYGLAI